MKNKDKNKKKEIKKERKERRTKRKKVIANIAVESISTNYDLLL
jgi:hypothetical protein